MPELHDVNPHAERHENGGTDEISVAGLSGALADSQTPSAHKTSHQDGGTDEISVAGLKGQQIFVPYNGKIADITHADTNKYYLDLATALSETRKIIALTIVSPRAAGVGRLNFYPNEGVQYFDFYDSFSTGTVIIANGTQRLQYSLGVANDDFDLYCLGYVVEA